MSFSHIIIYPNHYVHHVILHPADEFHLDTLYTSFSLIANIFLQKIVSLDADILMMLPKICKNSPKIIILVKFYRTKYE